MWPRIVIGAGIAAAIVFAIFGFGMHMGAQSNFGAGWWEPGGTMGGYGWGHMGWMPFMGMLFWLFVLFLIAAAVMGLTRRRGSAFGRPGKEERRSRGLEILEERYARGEINRDEYLQKKQDILGHSSAV